MTRQKQDLCLFVGKNKRWERRNTGRIYGKSHQDQKFLTAAVVGMGESRENPTTVWERCRGNIGGWESIFSFEHLYYKENDTIEDRSCQAFLEHIFYIFILFESWEAWYNKQQR